MKTKHEQLDKLMKSQIWIDFNKHEQVENYLEAIWEDDFRIYNKESFLQEMEWFSDSIASPDELYWIEDMLADNSKEVYKLRNHMKYYLKKWGR